MKIHRKVLPPPSQALHISITFLEPKCYFVKKCSKCHFLTFHLVFIGEDVTYLKDQNLNQMLKGDLPNKEAYVPDDDISKNFHILLNPLFSSIVFIHCFHPLFSSIVFIHCFHPLKLGCIYLILSPFSPPAQTIFSVTM